MKVVILFALIFCLATCDKWAVLVAGSNTWSNYRHQADVFHSYQSLVAGGFDPDRIITFAYDDIANNPSNPFKGKVFNKPTFSDPGVDVYDGIRIDYKGADVTP
jgi:legumain